MPQDYFCMLKSDDDNVKWGDGFVGGRWMSMSSILDSYQLTEDQVNELEELGSMDYQQLYTRFTDSHTYDGFGFDYFYRNIGQQSAKFWVTEMQWRSVGHMYIKKSQNPFDDDAYFYKRVTEEEYNKFSKKKKSEYKRVPYHDLREVVLVGHDTFIVKGRVKDQIRREQYGLGRVPLQLMGVQKNPMQAIMTILAPLQIEYSIGWFHIERLLAQAGGKAIELWMHNKPEGWSDEKWLFYARHKSLIVREYDEDISALGGDRSMQQAIDLGLSNSFQYLIQYVGLIESTAQRLVGTNPASQGFLRGDELVGNVQANIVQSSMITQGIYYDTKRAIEQVLNDCADKIKVWWKSGTTKIWLTDKEVIPLQATDDLPNYEYAVFVKNDASDDRSVERLEQLAQLALQSGGAEFLDVIFEMEEGENASEKKAIVKKGMQEIRRQQAEMAARAQQTQEVMAQAKAEEVAVKKMEAQAKLETPIAVAEVNRQAKKEVEQLKIQHDENVKEIETTQKEIDRQQNKGGQKD